MYKGAHIQIWSHCVRSVTYENDSAGLCICPHAILLRQLQQSPEAGFLSHVEQLKETYVPTMKHLSEFIHVCLAWPELLPSWDRVRTCQRNIVDSAVRNFVGDDMARRSQPYGNCGRIDKLTKNRISPQLLEIDGESIDQPAGGLRSVWTAEKDAANEAALPICTNDDVRDEGLLPCCCNGGFRHIEIDDCTICFQPDLKVSRFGNQDLEKIIAMNVEIGKTVCLFHPWVDAMFVQELPISI